MFAFLAIEKVISDAARTWALLLLFLFYCSRPACQHHTQSNLFIVDRLAGWQKWIKNGMPSPCAEATFFRMLAATMRLRCSLICSAESVPKHQRARQMGCTFEVKRHCFCPARQSYDVWSNAKCDNGRKYVFGKCRRCC